MSDNTNNSQQTENQSSPRRLRKHSYKEAIITAPNKMSGKLPDVNEIGDENGENIENNKLILKEEFAKKSTAQKLDSVADAINKLYDKMNEVTEKVDEELKPIRCAVFDEQLGLLPRMETFVDHAKSADERIQTLTEENLQLRDELDILKGVVHKMSNQMESADRKINQLVTKSMEDNLVISGILNDLPKKNARKQIHQFLQEEMDLRDVNDMDVLKVYRIGQPQQGKNRPIMMHCTPDLRRYIMWNAPLLKNRTNTEGGKYYINQQLPESVAERNREIRQTIKDQQSKEELLPQAAKSKFFVRHDKLFVNGQLTKKTIQPPQVQQLFPDEKTQEKINSIKLRTFRLKPQAGSTFRMMMFEPKSMDEVKLAYIKMFQDHSSADHIAVASVVHGEEAFNDNGKFGSGYRMLRVLKQHGMDNIALFMTRQFGGVHLGPRRFKIITDLATIATEKMQETRSRRTERSTQQSQQSTAQMNMSDDEANTSRNIQDQQHPQDQLQTDESEEPQEEDETQEDEE